MKLRKALSLIVLVVIVVGSLAGAASAAPRKEPFTVTWVNGREGANDPADPWCASVTGNAYHEKCGSLVFDFVECTNDKVCGRYEFWEHAYTASPEVSGMQFTWRIDVGPNDYWEGTGAMVQRHKSWTDVQYGQIIALMEGRGHGKFEGLLLKGEHWYEPGGPPPFPGLDFKAVVGGEIIQTGKQ
jgi:hypothetical protein